MVLEAWDCELWKFLNYMGYLPMEFHGIVDSGILACFGSILWLGQWRLCIYNSQERHYSLVPILTCTDFVFE